MAGVGREPAGQAKAVAGAVSSPKAVTEGEIPNEVSYCKPVGQSKIPNSVSGPQGTAMQGGKQEAGEEGG
jgi:hypothetical protein